MGIDALRDAFLNILGISLLPTVLVALSGGWVLAQRGARHVAVISETLDQLTSGNLEARVGHTKMDSTVRYLGVDLDDALSLSEGIDL